MAVSDAVAIRLDRDGDSGVRWSAGSSSWDSTGRTRDSLIVTSGRQASKFPQTGGAGKLQPSENDVSSVSPVAWSSFSTGTNQADTTSSIS